MARQDPTPAQQQASVTADPAARWVTCPQCGGRSLYGSANRFRPFCSERCKQIDLGAWASEKYVFGGKPGETPSPDLPEDAED